MLFIRTRKKAGNTLTEMALPLSIVVLTVVATIPEMVKAQGSILKETLGGTNMNAAFSVSGFAYGVPAPPDPSRDKNGNGTLSLTLSNGQVVTLDGVPVDPSATIETAGVNGLMNQYSNYIADLASALEAAGNLTPEQASILKELANQGHKIAEIQGLLENAAKNSNGDPKAFGDTIINYNGKNYTARELAAMTDNYLQDLRTEQLSQVRSAVGATI